MTDYDDTDEDRRVQDNSEESPHSVLKRNHIAKMRKFFDSHDWEGMERLISKTFDRTSEDELTGLLNRRMFTDIVDRNILPRMRRAVQKDGTYPPFGFVVMLDIDDFKQFNTLFGHDGGDEVLKAFGSALKEHFRGDDVICRFGGDEFIIVAQGILDEEIKRRMERLRKHFENEPLRLKLVEHKGHTHETANILFTWRAEPIANPDEFQKQFVVADEGVMRSKSARDSLRNRRGK